MPSRKCRGSLLACPWRYSSTWYSASHYEGELAANAFGHDVTRVSRVAVLKKTIEMERSLAEAHGIGASRQRRRPRLELQIERQIEDEVARIGRGRRRRYPRRRHPQPRSRAAGDAQRGGSGSSGSSKRGRRTKPARARRRHPARAGRHPRAVALVAAGGPARRLRHRFVRAAARRAAESARFRVGCAGRGCGRR